MLIILLYSCSNPRYRDDKGVYIYVDSCVKSSSHLQTNIVVMGDMIYPQTNVVVMCDSSVTVKTYLGK